MVALAAPVGAQSWNDRVTRQLVDRAITRRQTTLADSSLHSYRAKAHGVVTFRAEIGAESAVASRSVKGDEIEVEVYWERPNRSKQIIYAWRDTTLFPTDLNYHRDHLGIVTDDFGPSIRIGDGDEVRDVIHPLAPSGPIWYDYRLGDSLVIASPGGRVVLVAVDVRPKDAAQPAVVGTLFLDRDRAQLVRSRFTFTAAAYLDHNLEDITIRLERSLVDGAYWLPYRQQIEIRRRSGWLDFPLRGVIRGDWEIGDYQLNQDFAVSWAGPSIAGLRLPAPDSGWEGPLGGIIDLSLAPSARQDLDRVRVLARQVGGRLLLDGLPRLRPSVSRFSDFLRYNRVEGLAVGVGLGWRAGGVGAVRATAGYGFSSRRVTGSLRLARQLGVTAVELEAERSVVDGGAFAAGSGLVNSVIAQESGRDLGDYLRLDRVRLRTSTPIGLTKRLSLSAARERPYSLATAASPARGTARANPQLGGASQWTFTAVLAGARTETAGGGASFEASAEFGAANYGRVSVVGNRAWSVAGGLAEVRGGVGIGTGQLPAWRAFSIGGPGTLVGEPFRSLGGRTAGWIAAEWLKAVPGPALRLGPLGRTSATAQIGPLVAVGWAGGPLARPGPRAASGGLSVTTGLVIELLDRSVRFEIGKSLNRTGGVGVSVDVARAWWSIL